MINENKKNKICTLNLSKNQWQYSRKYAIKQKLIHLGLFDIIKKSLILHRIIKSISVLIALAFFPSWLWFNLIIYHFNIHEKLSLIRCE